jgi:hypothetical protein
VTLCSSEYPPELLLLKAAMENDITEGPEQRAAAAGGTASSSAWIEISHWFTRIP